jgi:hypothetical protein
MLNLVLENPDTYTQKALSEIIGIGLDSIKRKARVLRANGFDIINSGYPDYFYTISNYKKYNEKQ